MSKPIVLGEKEGQIFRAGQEEFIDTKVWQAMKDTFNSFDWDDEE